MLVSSGLTLFIWSFSTISSLVGRNFIDTVVETGMGTVRPLIEVW